MKKYESKVEYNLSVSDLWLIVGFKEAFTAVDENAISQLLFTNGMDTTQGYEENLCQHRNLQGKLTTCIRYEGAERTDKEWVLSGAASIEAVIGSSSDPHMRATLRTMSRQVQQDRAWGELEQQKSRGALNATNT